MNPRQIVALLMAALTAACTTPRVIRLDTGQGAPLQYRPPSESLSVKVSEDEFEEALTRLVLHAPLTLRSPQHGWLVRTSSTSAGLGRPWQNLVIKSFGGLCKPGQIREGCVSLLDDVMQLSEWDKLGIALGLSFDPLRESIARSVQDTLASQLFYTVIATGLVGWIILAANPEPVFTKAAAIVSAVLLIYLGVDAFLSLLRASRELKRATDRATTFEELQGASQRFADAVGPAITRVFVLAVTVVVSHGMAGGAALLASRLSTLPRFTEAAAQGASLVGINLTEVGQVSAVAVVEGNVAITLAPTAVAMVASSQGGGVAGPHGLPPGGPGEWVQVNEAMPASARSYQSQVTGAPPGHAYRVKGNNGEVDFDGFDPADGVLLEVKGPNLAKFFDGKLDPKGFFKGADKFVDQALRQLQVAGRTPIRWVTAEKKLAEALQKLFDARNIPIEVVHIPVLP
jgi:Restriction endonuclease fold toxin 5